MRLPSALPPACMLAMALLGGCSGSETPRPATVLAAEPSHSDFGALRVHYNVLPTLAMNPAVARSYGVPRDAGQALLVVALRELRQGAELPADGAVTATAVDLSGRRQQIVLRTVRTGGYADHVGLVRISRHDTLRFDLQVQSANGGGSVKFQRNF